MCDPDVLLPDFRIRFPEFDSVSDDRVKVYIGDACAIFSCCEVATLYLAAHLLVLDSESGASTGGSGGSMDGGNGVVTSETVGKVSTSYANVSSANAKDAFYETTPYGRKYIQFRNACPGYRVTVRSR